MKIHFGDCPDPFYFSVFWNEFKDLVDSVYFWDVNKEYPTPISSPESVNDFLILDLAFHRTSLGRFDVFINDWKWIS